MGIFSRKRGPVSTAGLLLDQTWDDPSLDTAYAAVRGGDLSLGLELLKTSPLSTDLRSIRVTGLANAAIGRSEQLELELQASPRDPDLLAWLAQTLVFEAWQVRTAMLAMHVSAQRQATFRDILRTAHEVAEAAIEAAPDDATPWCALQRIALGLRKSPAELESIFGQVLARQPDSYLGHAWQVQTLAPKWSGRPVEDLLQFGLDTAAKSQSGRALGPGILSLALAEGMVDIMGDETREQSERSWRFGQLVYDRKERLVDAEGRWWRRGHQPEAADLEAHQAVVYVLRILGRPILAMEHAKQANGRVSSIPWRMSGDADDPLTAFATAVANEMRT